MSTVMGLTWTVGITAAIVNNPILWYIFEISVPIQGILIFISFVCKRRVLEMLKSKIKKSCLHAVVHLENCNILLNKIVSTFLKYYNSFLSYKNDSQAFFEQYLFKIIIH